MELPLLYDRAGRNTGSRATPPERRSSAWGWATGWTTSPSELSGGQQQRVAIARALVTQPALLLADEPTGNLDTRTSVEVLALFQELNDQGITIVLVTHEPDIAQYARRIVEVRDGRIIRDERGDVDRDAMAAADARGRSAPRCAPEDADMKTVDAASSVAGAEHPARTRCARCSRCSASSSAWARSS